MFTIQVTIHSDRFKLSPQARRKIHRKGEEIVENARVLFKNLESIDGPPEISRFVAAAKACGRAGDLETGMRIHSRAIKEGLIQSNRFLANTLLDMYAKCGRMDRAREIFDGLERRCVVSWTALILGYVQNGESELGLELFSRMEREEKEEGGVKPDARLFYAAVKACVDLVTEHYDDKDSHGCGTKNKFVQGKQVKLWCLEKGKLLHDKLSRIGLEEDIFVTGSLVDLFARCGSMADARRVFDGIVQHSVLSWNAIIAGYAHSGELERCFWFYGRMQQEGSKLSALRIGARIHWQLVESGYERDVFVASTVVDMFAKCGSMARAREAFDRIAKPCLVSWNSIMMGYAQGGEGKRALEFFYRMDGEGLTPDARSFVAALKACANLAAAAKEDEDSDDATLLLCVEKGGDLHSRAEKHGYTSNIYVANVLIDMYTKCGSLDEARKVFDKMIHRSVMSWNSIIMGYAQAGDVETALNLFSKMQEQGIQPDARSYVATLKACSSFAEGDVIESQPAKLWCLQKGSEVHRQLEVTEAASDIFVSSTLVDMYSKCGDMAMARKVFDRMSDPNVVLWNVMITGYAQNSSGSSSEEAVKLFTRMQLEEGFEADNITLVAALKACGSLGALNTGKEIYRAIVELETGLEHDQLVVASLIDFYGKCGSMVEAQQVFESVPSVRKNTVTWNSLIAGYTHQADVHSALELYERMKGDDKRPAVNGVTFLCLLNACSHAGLVDKGQKFFAAMVSLHGITPGIEHYTCLVDLLGRSNHLDEALTVLREMPLRGNKTIWMTLLSSCRKWRNVDIGTVAFKKILEIDNRDSAAYILMTNLYASAKRWDESVHVEMMRMNAGALKKPGESWWIDSHGKVHKFVAGDNRHPQSEQIFGKLRLMFLKLREQGYLPDLNSVFRNISDEEKESALFQHSEKLAICCALINSAAGTTVRITKNLRVCDDCHKATSYISKLERRTIICRDASRFHVFQDGKCSCDDFW
ncbi:pentatricopeptide repeat-containing protein At3g26782, mitochondrial-like [Selaginella moellendorffii]|uniref:pentatricopeptide repeat-containing protein At3g26782, mitochondrial-like n=1 Tax=Selaginella moellendorffii TaxID=88036 RepID=UPI000D1C2BD3|nr:pentatricopeptide repeat-containing protein At3g26782, mitochondrial-like [Selaginella moellendorffii]|eukprot:XP_024521485.1 pentatricopeptide repeat-containing protein At3g26782, mitochondrial-like [Selaginella moellendorffii]